MAARLKDDGRMLSVKLVRVKDFAKIAADIKNPPRPSAELIELFTNGRTAQNKI